MDNLVNFDSASGFDAIPGDNISPYNPSSPHLGGRQALAELDSHRTALANMMQRNKRQIVFCPNMTYANNLAISGFAKAYQDLACMVAYDPADHSSIVGPAKLHSSTNISALDLANKNYDQIANLPDKPCLLSFSAVSGETGLVLDLRSIRSALDKVNLTRNQPIYLHVDASQALYSYRLDTLAKYADLVSFSASKYGGPHTAALYSSKMVRLEPILAGGSQEFGLVPGTQDMGGIAGLALTLKAHFDLDFESLTSNSNLILDKLLELGCQIVDEPYKRSPHIIRAIIRDSKGELQDNETLLYKLEQEGVLVGLGSACQASSLIPSMTLKARGYTDQESWSSIRISLNSSSTREDTIKLVEVLHKLLVHKQ